MFSKWIYQFYYSSISTITIGECSQFH